MSGPFLTISDRLAAMANQADSIGRVFANRSTHARTLNDEGVSQFARLSLLMHAAAQVLRAGCDPTDSTREDDTNERDN